MSNDLDITALLTKAGVLVKTSVHFFRGNRSLKPEELGLPSDVDEIHNLFKLGHKKLNPEKWYKQFGLYESRINASVNQNTFPFYGGMFRFCPNEALPGLLDTVEKCQTDIVELGEQFKSSWSQIKNDLLIEWEMLAYSLDLDVDKVLASVEDSFPEASTMSFGVDIMTFQITLPQEYQEDLDAQQISMAAHNKRKEVAAQAEIQMRNQTDQFVRDSIAALREAACKTCNEMLNSMEKGKTAGVHQSTLDRMSNFISYVKRMNFTGDSVLEAELNQFEQRFLQSTASDYRNNDKALGQLRNGIQALATRSKELSAQDLREVIEKFGSVGRRKLIFK